MSAGGVSVAPRLAHGVARCTKRTLQQVAVHDWLLVRPRDKVAPTNAAPMLGLRPKDVQQNEGRRIGPLPVLRRAAGAVAGDRGVGRELGDVLTHGSQNEPSRCDRRHGHNAQRAKLLNGLVDEWCSHDSGDGCLRLPATTACSNHP